MNAPTHSQTEAVRARGNVLVVAGAGTGKTRTLVERCLALVCDGASLENMLLVTYTISAAAEMRQRIRAALRQKLEGIQKQPDRDAARQLAEQLDYVPIPEKVVGLVEQSWKQIAGPDGKPVWTGSGS